MEKIRRWAEAIGNHKRWFACLSPPVLSLLVSAIANIRQHKRLLEGVAAYEPTRPPMYYILTGALILLEAWPFLSIGGIVAAVLYLLFHREPNWNAIDRKTLGDILRDLCRDGDDPGAFQRFDSACDLIETLEDDPDSLPKVSKIVLKGMSAEERGELAFLFDGKDDRNDLLQFLKKKRSKIYPDLISLLDEISEWRAKNGGKSLPPAGRKERDTPEPVSEIETPKKKQVPAWGKIIKTFSSFGVEVRLSNTVTGPSITRYGFVMDNPAKLSKVTGMAGDVALALGVPPSHVRIAPVPGEEGVIGVEVPKKKPVPVLLSDLLESATFQKQKSPTAFAVGKTVDGKDVIGVIENLPHVLIAGTTGSGKSVCMNCLIVSLLRKSGPERVRFIMIDPKMVELTPYNGIPHLLIPVVTDAQNAPAALQMAVDEMERRYQVFSEIGVKKLEDFNRRSKETMPSWIIVIDELSDLMIAAKDEIETSIIRIAQKGRAAGIHLVVATQRPSADVITGLIKSNIPSRIAFTVASAMESRIILDSGGAENLIGKGDMIYAPNGETAIRVQGAFVSERETAAAIAAAKEVE